MKSVYSRFLSTPTPQSEPLDATQVANNAGGYTYAIDPFARLDRFLILGAEGGTYYVGETVLIKDNVSVIAQCLALDGRKTIDTIVAVSQSGRAPKNDPAIFALACAAADPQAETRAYALAQLPLVCRIPTHLFHFVDFCQQMRGWGRGLRRAVGRWYADMGADKLAYELLKYPQRDGWSNRDVLRLAHPKSTSPVINALYGYAAGSTTVAFDQLPGLVQAVDEAKHADLDHLCMLIREHGLTREIIPTESLRYAVVWEALLESMPLTALIRNLGKMTQVGLLKPLSTAANRVATTLSDGARLQRSRVHPLAILNAARVYSQGHGDKGALTWTPVPKVVEALDAAFYLSFANVVPSGKRLQLAIDISASMDGNRIAGTALDARTAAAAMALVTAATEPDCLITAFCHQFSLLNISPRQRLSEIVHEMKRLRMGATDCALPMIAAAQQGWSCDGFAIYTDNETWAGSEHPMVALRRYRQQFVQDAKLVVVGMTATQFSIADPRDPGCLDVVGFDTATPAVISDFLRRTHDQ